MRPAQSGFKVVCTALALSAVLGVRSPAYASAFTGKAPLADTQATSGKRGLPLAQKKSHKSGKAECEFDGETFRYKRSGATVREIGSEKMLGQGETVHGVWCSEKRAFMLTSRKWIIIEAKQDKETLGQGSFGELFSHKDMTRIFSRPFVSWVATDDRIFVQTDRIREIPIHGDTIIHGDGMDVTNAKMAVVPGFLFFAPVGGKIVVDQIGTDFSVDVQLPRSDYGSSFTENGGEVRFGSTKISPMPNPKGGFTINP